MYFCWFKHISPAFANIMLGVVIIMDIVRTPYEKEIIKMIENEKDDLKLGKIIRKWYADNKEDLKYETPESFRESNYTEEQRYSDWKNRLSFGMK